MLILTFTPRKLFEGKAWYSMIKNTKPLSKIRIWIVGGFLSFLSSLPRIDRVVELPGIQERDCMCVTGLMCVMLLCVYVCDGTCACWYILVSYQC